MFGALVILGLAMAVITSWMLDKYDTAWHPRRSVRPPADGGGSTGSSPPFPGGELKNLFWFIQVTRPETKNSHKSVCVYHGIINIFAHLHEKFYH